MNRKSVTVFGVMYDNTNGAAKAIVEAHAKDCVLSWKTLEMIIHRAIKNDQNLDGVVQGYIDRMKKAQALGKKKLSSRPKSIVVFGLPYDSITAAAKAIAEEHRLNWPAMKTAIHEAIKNNKNIDDVVQGYIERMKDRRVWLGGKEYPNFAEAAKTVDVSGCVLRRADQRGETPDEYLASRRRRIRLLRFNGKQYASAAQFAREFGLCPQTVAEHIRAGNNLEFVMLQRGIKAAPKPEKYPTRPTKAGKIAVQFSGWVWSSRSAMLTYYNQGIDAGSAKLNTLTEAAEFEGRGWGFALLEILTVHHCNKHLDRQNRFSPEIEAELPPGCLPIDQPRLGPLNAWDRMSTPDWDGGVWYANTQKEPEIIKTLRRMEAEKGIEKAESQT